MGKGEGVAGNADLSYSITDEQDEEKCLAQTPESEKSAQGKAKSTVEDDEIEHPVCFFPENHGQDELCRFNISK